MLLPKSVKAQQNLYNDLQNQMEALEAKQREIQIHLQQLGSISTEMESAALLMQEVIAKIITTCPDKLPAYEQLVTSLFNSAAIAQLEQSNEPTSEPIPPNVATPPVRRGTETPTIEVDKVVVADASSQPVIEEIDQISPTLPAESASVEREKQQSQGFASTPNVRSKGNKRPQAKTLLKEATSQGEVYERDWTCVSKPQAYGGAMDYSYEFTSPSDQTSEPNRVAYKISWTDTSYDIHLDTNYDGKHWDYDYKIGKGK